MLNTFLKGEAGTRLRFMGMLLSAILVLLSVFTLTQKGLNFGLDFTGGYLTEFTTSQSVELKELQSFIAKNHNGEFELTAQGNSHFQLREAPSASTTANSLDWQSAVTQNDDINAQVLSSAYIGSQVGDELFDQGCLAMFAAMIAVMIYLAVRFEWRLAVGSVVALVHDLILVLGLFSLLQIEFNLTVLASLLAIIGYSLNDSIIVGDRVRELLRVQSNNVLSPATIINNAIKSTLTRTLITSGTTLATVASVWLLAGAPLQGFAIALFTGIVVGTFSSICIAATLPELLGLSAKNYEVKVDAHTQTLLDMP
ncbi:MULTISPECIES: protein translocase subunit SecF [unclassified Pseudoalteromonas]|uniref:protein translocase subunit SecF n=1 Tax=unclassified Pseudoalteromonas TaxID=194690 RepID=UPI00160266D4|nr:MULTISPECIES: protein translocase subunit SecF [unclassified Pseudoalteromonas]MBB1297105.1 protein translocase subunit SecF [Pseudoalteromonas sp. SR41-7]MBB1344591.1 protein translocase subunit SecF [Pseudoalteromonas sp. SG45-2]MBB1350558.1 protein translocase subunit SecF [Pseudoalteromonas sp. SG45-3]MBB1358843.1 protein translocase subunit SecF [Pseudoalteromonas sp. SG45-6]